MLCFSSLIIGKWIEPVILKNSDPQAHGPTVCIPGEVKCRKLHYKYRQGLLEEAKISPFRNLEIRV